jgi:Raf kinase inhibitor-like YbhB/YbcL family protein
MADTDTKMLLTSTAFKENETIPIQYTCKGDNINPPLNIIDVPSDTKSLSLIMHDPDTPTGDYLHWMMWDIGPSTQSISANSVPVGAVQGANDSQNNVYAGPCPPKGTGTHRYMFELYALDISLNLKPDTTSRAQLEEAMKNHILEKTTLTGLFTADT